MIKSGRIRKYSLRILSQLIWSCISELTGGIAGTFCKEAIDVVFKRIVSNRSKYIQRLLVSYQNVIKTKVLKLRNHFDGVFSMQNYYLNVQQSTNWIIFKKPLWLCLLLNKALSSPSSLALPASNISVDGRRPTSFETRAKWLCEYVAIFQLFDKCFNVFLKSSLAWSSSYWAASLYPNLSFSSATNVWLSKVSSFESSWSETYTEIPILWVNATIEVISRSKPKGPLDYLTKVLLVSPWGWWSHFWLVPPLHWDKNCYPSRIRSRRPSKACCTHNEVGLWWQIAQRTILSPVGPADCLEFFCAYSVWSRGRCYITQSFRDFSFKIRRVFVHRMSVKSTVLARTRAASEVRSLDARKLVECDGSLE